MRWPRISERGWRAIIMGIAIVIGLGLLALGAPTVGLMFVSITAVILM